MPAPRRKKRSSDGWIIDTAEEFRDLPLWAGVIAAAAVLVILAFVVPSMLMSASTPKGTIPLGPIIAPFVRLLGFLLSGAILLFSLYGAAERGAVRLADLLRARWRGRNQAAAYPHSLRPATWQDFERKLAGAYEPLGWRVQRRGGPLPDGGVDIELLRPGEKVLVQCKYWSHRQVGVRQVRELWGVVAHEAATRAVLATTGTFTADAIDFSRGKSLDLMDRSAVEAFLAGAAVPQLSRSSSANSVGAEAQPICAACGRPMVLRTARRGAHTGEQFWGCSGFPECRETMQLAGSPAR